MTIEIPETPEEMQAVLLMALISRAYLDLTIEARRRRLTEHDIGTIERRILQMRAETDAFAAEFDTFETEPAAARAFKDVQDFFAVTRAERVKKVEQK